MRIRFTADTMVHGRPEFRSGETHDVPELEALELVERGHAVAAGPEPKKEEARKPAAKSYEE